MQEKAELYLSCSAASLYAAAIIAPDYGLDVGEVAELIEELGYADPAKARCDATFFRRAEQLRAVLTDLLPAAKRLRQLEFGDEDASFMVPVVTVPNLATMMEYLRVDYLSSVALGLRGMLDVAWLADMRDKVVNPRSPLIAAMMSTAAQFWFDHGDEFPDGEFIETPEGLVPREGTGVEFITRVVMAAAETVEIDDIRANITTMQDMIGMTGYLEDVRAEAEAEAAEQAAKRAHLRVVK